MLPAARWGRLRVQGLECVPAEGALLIVPNHDSQWDAPVIGFVLLRKRRLRFLARADLWRNPLARVVLDALGQIPIERGAGDAAALERAAAALRRGEAVGVFPEGRLSGGERLRARSGVGRLAAAEPGVAVVLCAVEGTSDYVRFPTRPRVTVSFFAPAGGDPRRGEEPLELAGRLLAEVRERVEPVPRGWRP